MKHRDLGAGKPARALTRRRFLQAGLAGVLTSPLTAALAEPPLLTPGPQFFGARLQKPVKSQGAPATGMPGPGMPRPGMPGPGLPAPGLPEMLPDTLGPMTMFVMPVAVAAGPMEIYIADAGLGSLFRFDPTLNAMAIIPGVRVNQQTRIAALSDGSVLVAGGSRGLPRRYSRAGLPIHAVAPQNTGGRFDEVVADPATGRYLGLDRVQRRVEEVHPMGQSAVILAEDLLPRLPGALALDNQTLYAAGDDCKCIVAVDLYRREKRVLAEDLTQVSAMAAGDGWLVVVDNMERTLRIYRDNVLRGDPDYDSLKLVNPLGISLARSTLYVADAGARRISTFRLRS